MSTINKRVKEVRMYAGQTQEDFAYKVGISRSNLASIETGKATPTYEALKKISDTYNINAAFFFIPGELSIEDFILKGDIVGYNDSDTNKYVLPKVWPAKEELDKRIAENPLSRRIELLRDGKRHADARLRRDLSKNEPSLLSSKEQIEDCVAVVDILHNVFINYFDDAPDPSEMDYYVTENSESFVYEFPDQIDYKEYRRRFVAYYQGLMPYLPALHELKSCIENFLKEVAPIDRFEIIS